MSDFKIRTFIESDFEPIKNLLLQLSGEEVADEVLQDRLLYFQEKDFEFLYVGECDHTVAALLGFRIRENVEGATRYGEVTMLVVDEQYRRKGYATCLLNFAHDLAKEKGCIGLWLVSGFGREKEAHEFYLDQGFEITGYRFVKKF